MFLVQYYFLIICLFPHKDPKRTRRFFSHSTPLPYLAIRLKKAIIRNRWKLKSRRDLKVLTHFQARAGELAPTRNSPAVHDDIFIIQCCPFMHKQGACASGEASVMERRQGADCAASRSRRFSLFLTQAARNCSRTDYADRFSVHSRFASG